MVDSFQVRHGYETAAQTAACHCSSEEAEQLIHVNVNDKDQKKMKEEEGGGGGSGLMSKTNNTHYGRSEVDLSWKAYENKWESFWICSHFTPVLQICFQVMP